MFPDDLTSDRLYVFWCGIHEEAGLPGLRIHDCRHTHASHAVMNGESLHVAERLPGHRRAGTTNRYVHLDDATLSQAAARVAGAIHRKLRSHQVSHLADAVRFE